MDGEAGQERRSAWEGWLCECLRVAGAAQRSGVEPWGVVAFCYRSSEGSTDTKT